MVRRRFSQIFIFVLVVFSSMLVHADDDLHPANPYLKIHTDPWIPNFGHEQWIKAPYHAVESVKNGNWTDPTVWSTGKVPDSNSVVRIYHTVFFQAKTEVAVAAVYPGGSLQFSTTQDTELSVIHLLVHAAIPGGAPAGILEIGTEQHPVPAHVKAIVTFRDTPINTSDANAAFPDPAQYGNGMLVFGVCRLFGSPKNPTFVRLAEGIPAGRASLSTFQSISGWNSGDLLVIPDTRHLRPEEITTDPTFNIRRREDRTEYITAASAGGTGITLSKSTQFDHPAAKDGDGVTLARRNGEPLAPHIANLTRNILFRSKDPSKVRGHTAFFHRAEVDVFYVAFEALGRTTFHELNNTEFDSVGNATKIGTNQKARYAVHTHHLFGPARIPSHGYQCRFVGNSVYDQNKPFDERCKWGFSIHASHYGLYKWNTVAGMSGASIITEDGSESFNLIEGNFATDSYGTARKITRYDVDGVKGAGFWFRGGHNYIVGNVAGGGINEGYGYYFTTHGSPDQAGSARQPVSVPLFQGANHNDPAQSQILPIKSLPVLQFENNEGYGSAQNGAGLWQANELTKVPELVNTTIWHTRLAVDLDYIKLTFKGLLIRGDGGRGKGIFVHTPGDFQKYTDIDAQGLEIFYSEDDRPSGHLTMENIYLRNKINILLSNNQIGYIHRTKIFRNLKFDPLPGLPTKAFDMRFDKRAYTTTNVNEMPIVLHREHNDVYDYNGVAGHNLRIYYDGQAPSAPFPKKCFDVNGEMLCTCSQEGLTNQQCWDLEKRAALFELATCVDAAAHPEVVGGFACPLPNDNTPPTVPTNVRATAFSENEIFVTWDPSTDPETSVSHYRVFRNGNAYKDAMTNKFTDSGLLGDTEYRYKVIAVNPLGLESAPSAEVKARTLKDAKPPVLTSVVAAGDPKRVVVGFNEPINEADAETVANFGINNGIVINSATLSDPLTVILETSDLVEGLTYTLSASNIRDRAATPNMMGPATKTFEYTRNVPPPNGGTPGGGNPPEGGTPPESGTPPLADGGSESGSRRQNTILRLDQGQKILNLLCREPSGTVNLFSRRGDEIRTGLPPSGEFVDGKAVFPWEGKNNQGAFVSNGGYLVRCPGNESYRILVIK